MKNTHNKAAFIFLIFVIIQSCGIKKSFQDRPDVSEYAINNSSAEKINENLFIKDQNSLRKNEFGQWELVAEGNPLELGNNIGVLTEELMVKQEQIFMSKIESFVPNEKRLNFIKKFLKVYNRRTYKHIKEEYKTEIYGLSQYNSDEYNYLADKYLRSLYLHGAHDLGHALQDLALVGCSSFAVWGDKTPDGNILLGRNFDFYVGDEFAQEKIISFISPNQGYKFMNVCWAGMIGVMSGMNVEGITVTMNAGKSNIPFKAKTPISLVTREILQYASTIEEAIAIAKSKEVFVSESIMVGSGKENKAILIEMSPKKFDVFEVDNSSQLICSNHFQSDRYKNDRKNNKHKRDSHSQYRHDKLTELLEKDEQITPEIAVSILRNKEGLENTKLGYGNEKALNQLLAHHGVVFQPKEKLVWISSNPYQLGEFVAFQLDSVFNNSTSKHQSLSISELLIEEDDFQYSTAFENYEKYRKELLILQKLINQEKKPSQTQFDTLIALNSDFWEGYNLAGDFYYSQQNYALAKDYYNQALTKEITTLPAQLEIEKRLKKLKKKTQ